MCGQLQRLRDEKGAILRTLVATEVELQRVASRTQQVPAAAALSSAGQGAPAAERWASMRRHPRRTPAARRMPCLGIIRLATSSAAPPQSWLPCMQGARAPGLLGLHPAA